MSVENSAKSNPAIELKVVSELIRKARAAQREYEHYSQQQVDDIVTAAGWAIMHPAHNRNLAEMAVHDTGLGNVDDKILKNHRKTLGLLRDLKNAKTVGIIAEYPERGLIEIARPVGVVAAITPSTNPAATPANKVINALKGRNAVIIAPSPKGLSTCIALVAYIHAELKKVGAPLDLVQYLPAPTTKEATQELMRQADLVVATGSQNNIRAAYASGTPAFGVGAGNVAAIIDSSANLRDAAKKISSSKTFDNATSCSSENSVVILDAVYESAVAALIEVGGVMLDANEKSQLQKTMWPRGKLDAAVTAQVASKIAALTGLSESRFSQARILMVEEVGTGSDYPYSGEKLAPVLTIYRARDFDHACQIVNALYDYQGAGHSVGIHTDDDAHVLRLGNELPVCRVIVNQAHCFATGGSFENGLPFSLSMGCGTWGGNNFSDNMHYKHYLNITRIVRSIPENIPTEEDIFGAYHRKYS
ncbi:aldehyde dehydrogenase family protein [Glaciimonas sp. Gout2]|uniref:acylating sulfoacetaldehyde dehydrogenase n=1 Tax=unclassified Glaciimonas TaxID=2644401 RepID=UPI002B23BD32|nr:MULTISPECIES: aldehyde dehydrogenase family protein [unclassified Glaciimonas]MEB0014283.1 aldehyde dehydrogenase family protein [Glaciimonas sp. Cout2]MEB0084422.1 aldehyde dehydrogenase family protein [Glaciimonas sp. Gout2]